MRPVTPRSLLPLVFLACAAPDADKADDTDVDTDIVDTDDDTDVTVVPDPTCTDGLLNGDETDVDCGGDCSPCEAGDACEVADDCVTSFCAESACAFARDCTELLATSPGLPSGRYPVDLDGDGALAPSAAQCDMTTDGGGWTLVLNYLRQDGTDPSVTVRTTDLPLQGSTTLGTDGSGDAETWGHAGNALMSVLDFDELRFFGRAGNHARVVDFATTSADAIAYVRTGTGSMGMDLYDPAFTRSLPGRVGAALPLHTDRAQRQLNSDAGDYALTDIPFSAGSALEGPLAVWGLGDGIDGWQVDDAASSDTHHQVWVRRAPCRDGVQDFDESGVDCGGTCGGCEALSACSVDADCLSGDCDEGTCSNAALAPSCAALLQTHPDLRTGAYLLDVDGEGGTEPHLAWCDMDFDGGGWTLVLSIVQAPGYDDTTEGPVLPGTTSHLPGAEVTLLAANATQVHVRTTDTQDTRSVTSVVGGPAITYLGDLEVIERPGLDLANWTGPLADQDHLFFTCGTSARWPSIYHSCGTNGLHLLTGSPSASRWNVSSPPGGPFLPDEPMQVYVR